MTFLVQNPSTYQLADVTEKMRITGSGNVGIGTTSPASTSGRNLTIGSVEPSVVLNASGSRSYSIASGGNFQYANNALCFHDNTAGATRMAIDSGGNVGIGTVIPGAYGGKLTIGDAADAFSNNVLLLTRYATFNIAADGVTAANGAVLDVSWATGGQGPLRFAFTGTERMRLQSSGNLVIGSTTVGSNRLGVVGSATDSMFRFQTGAVSTNYGSFGTTAGATYGYLGGGGGGALSGGTETDFVVRAESNLLLAIANTEVMRVDNSGRIGIGTTTPGTKLDVLVGNSVAAAFTSDSFASSPTLIVWNKDATSGRLIGFRATSSFTTVGTIETNGTTTTYGTSSDVRLKHDIVDAPDAASLIDAIQVRSFKWNADNSEQRYGMVAQELVEIAPEAVQVPEDPDDMMGVDYSKLVPILVKEIQSMRLRLAQLEGN
jgi:urease beta subunit